jgi:hypothetical protein
VELNAKIVALGVSHRGDWCALCPGNDFKTGRDLRDFVAVAHPDVQLGNAFGVDAVFDAVEERRWGAGVDFRVAEF